MNTLKMSLTRNIPFPNIYVQMLPEYKDWIYLEEEALENKGCWREAFIGAALPLDLEIGCGNGIFFNHQVRSQSQRNLLGIELKYKPLVQTIRRIKKDQLVNGKGIRFHARYIDRIFADCELDNVYIYFPDPWPKRRHKPNRLVRREFLSSLFKLQKPGSFVDIKTDSEEYFDFMLSEIREAPYEQLRLSRDLHHSAWAGANFVTAFERIFTSKGQPIFYTRLRKNE